MHDPIASSPAASATGRPEPAPLWPFGVALVLTLPWLNPFSPGPSAAAVPLLVSWVCAALVLLYLGLRRLPPSRAELVRALALAWCVAAALNALIGLMQYAGASAPLGVWINHTGPGEAFGNLRQRNQFSTLMAIGLASLLWWAGRGRPSTDTRAGTLALMLLAALLAAGNAASSSRTGLVQWAALAALTAFWLRGAERTRARRVLWVLLAALLAYGLAMLLLPWLSGHHNPAGDNALARLTIGERLCAIRPTLWRNVLHLISLRPWSGWGWGELDYAHFITLYDGPRFCDILDNAHNLPLHLAVELGLPVALLACAAVVALLWRARPWRETRASRQLAWAVLLVIGVHSLLEYPLWYGPFQLAALASLALLAWPAAAVRQRWLRRAGSGLGAALLLLCAVAGWNYHVASQIYLPPAQRDPAYREDTLARSRGLWLYADQVRFAELTMLELNADNAQQARALALALLHFSPEARVVRILLDADRLLGRSDELAFYAARFKAAFPDDYARWQASSGS